MEASAENEPSVKNLCVTCFKEKECENAFILEYEGTRFNDIFASCMGFKLLANSDSKYICLECIRIIIDFYTFREEAVKIYNEFEKSAKLQNHKPQSENNNSGCDDHDETDIKDAELFSVDDSNSSDITEQVKTYDTKKRDTLVEDSNREIIDNEEDLDFLLDEPDKIDIDKKLDTEEISAANMWPCPYCPLILPKDNPESIKNHRNSLCTGKKPRKYRKLGKEDDIIIGCLKCEFKSTSEDKFRKHYSKHTGSDLTEKPPRMFGCTICEYVSPRKPDVRIHIITHHSEGVELYKCDECEFSSPIYSRLQRHIRTIHKVEKVHKCGKCDFRTAYKYSLTVHEMKHKNVVERRLFYCYMCDFKTVYKTNLKNHVVLHRDPTDVPKFVCKICGFTTIYKKTEKAHMLLHGSEEEKKELRDKRFFRKQALIAKGTLLQCDQCDYQTYQSFRLRDHKESHKPVEEVTLYYCDQCQFKSRFKKSVERHSLKHKKLKRNLNL